MKKKEFINASLKGISLMLEDGIGGLKNIFFHNLILDFSQSDKHIFHITPAPAEFDRYRYFSHFNKCYFSHFHKVISHNLIKFISHNLISHRALAPAEWLDREQGVFRINNRQEFATSWYTFKVDVQTSKQTNKQKKLVHFQGRLSNK